MKRPHRPELRPVRCDYSPAYPAELTPDEYETLIEPGQHRRLLAAAAIAGVSLGGTLAAQGKEREQQVIAVLQKMDTAGFWYSRTSFGQADGVGGPVVVPQIPISFGNSHNGVFDAGRARVLAFELFQAYGLAPKPDVTVERDGVTTRLDALDATRKIGFKLRGRMPEKNQMFAGAQPEEAQIDLSDDEADRLQEAGHRIHVADLDSYPLMDGDEFTPTLAYLAGMVAFLNEVTTGPDIDLAAVLGGHWQQLSFPEPVELPAGATVREDKGRPRLIAKSAAVLRYEFTPAEAEVFEPSPPRMPVMPGEKRRPLDVDGVVLVELTCDGIPIPPTTGWRWRLLQEQSVGLELVSSRAFAPSTFDPSRPFSIEIQVEAGESLLPTTVRVSAPVKR